MTPLPDAAEGALADAIRQCGGEAFGPALFDLLQRATGADNLAVLAFRAGGPPLLLFHTATEGRAFAQVGTAYLGGAYLLDPIHALHLAGAPPGAYRLAEVAPDAFQRSRYYEEYYRQTTILDEICILARPGAGVTLTLCLGRDATSGRSFPARAIAACRRIAGIVAALAERQWAHLAAGEGVAPDVPARMAAALRDRHGIHLSRRQAEVALLVLRGHSGASIALRLGVSPQTVKVFRRQLYARCGLSSSAELFTLLLPLLDR